MTDDDLYKVYRRYRLIIRIYPLVGIKGAWFGRGIVTSSELSDTERRWTLAHELGHHVLHAGNRFYFNSSARDKQERQADLFAGWLLLGDSWEGEEPWDIAEEAQLPEDRIRRWLGLITGEATISTMHLGESQ